MTAREFHNRCSVERFRAVVLRGAADRCDVMKRDASPLSELHFSEPKRVTNCGKRPQTDGVEHKDRTSCDRHV